VPTDIEIARAATPRPLTEVAAKIGIPADALIPYGRTKAKLDTARLAPRKSAQDAALILVTAMSPTPAGEGKTTTTIGLGDGLARLGKSVAICLREPSLGPCFGQKGGATGGGHAQVIPMDEINLHFTGDFHAITAAHNLLAAMVDNHLYWGNSLGIDPRKVAWRRVMDMNDRALRSIVTSLGGNGQPVETGFDITVASEVMAIFCLATDLADLQARLGAIIVAFRKDHSPVTCADLKAEGAMTALLKEAFEPNLVQTLEGNPALIHGGPFANIAHGCNSVVATKTAMGLADFVVTEAGFGADLGAEKFFDIKCRKAGLSPKAVVVVATIRSLKMNGGVAKSDLGRTDVDALIRGCANLGQHLENLARFGVPTVVAINHFVQDSADEIAAVEAFVSSHGSRAILCRHWADGGAGTQDLAQAIVELVEADTARFQPLYEDSLPLSQKIETVAKQIYRAGEVVIDKAAQAKLRRWQEAGFGDLPVCMAKTQFSFSTDPNVLGAAQGHVVTVRDVRLCAGAGFVVALCGDIMTMPGLPRTPAAEAIGVDADRHITGLF
jgi:formate--tetrahydrofolate ligase